MELIYQNPISHSTCNFSTSVSYHKQLPRLVSISAWYVPTATLKSCLENIKKNVKDYFQPQP